MQRMRESVVCRTTAPLLEALGMSEEGQERFAKVTESLCEVTKVLEILS